MPRFSFTSATPTRRIAHLFALLALLALMAGPAAPARAAEQTFVVTKTTDTNDGACNPTDCSLREAVIAANTAVGPDSITLPADTFTLTIADASAVDEDAAATGDLDITSNITLVGAGASTTIVQAGTNTATSVGRVFEIVPAGNAAIAGVTVRNGSRSGSSDAGGIDNNGILTVTNSTVSGNQAYYYGGIGNSGTLTVTNSTVSGNQGNFGGGIVNFGTLTVTNSTVSGNQSGNSGGGIANSGTLTMTNSTVSGNQSDGSGGGIANYNTLTLINSTIAANTADINNDGIGRGGVYNASAANVKTTFRNTLIGNNTKGTVTFAKSDCDGTLVSQGYNLIESTDGCTITGNTTGNVTGQGPWLGALKDNGGPTFTQQLLLRLGEIVPDSPALNAGDPAGCTTADGTPLATDQRGVARPQGVRCDIGAFEFVPTRLELSGNNQPIADGSSTPNTANNTDFGSGALGQPIVRTFTITNPGDEDLRLAGTPAVTISGAAASDFSVTQVPTTPVAPRSSTTLGITFTPSAAGARTATVSITSNASGTPFTFAVSGTGAGQSQTIAFGPLPSIKLGSAPFVLNATATSGLAVSFSSSTPTICTVSGSTVTLLAAGTCTITAEQAGGGAFGAAAPVTQSFSVSSSSSGPQPQVYLPLTVR